MSRTAQLIYGSSKILKQKNQLTILFHALYPHLNLRTIHDHPGLQYMKCSTLRATFFRDVNAILMLSDLGWNSKEVVPITASGQSQCSSINIRGSVVGTYDSFWEDVTISGSIQCKTFFQVISKCALCHDHVLPTSCLNIMALGTLAYSSC